MPESAWIQLARAHALANRYHWAFLAGPKKHPKSGSRHIMYHAKDSLVVACRPPGIRSERAYVKDSDRAAMLLVRLVIGKIADHQRLEQILKEVPLRPDDANWNCVVWMANAFEKVVTDGRALSSSVKEWGSVRDKAMWYVDYKKKTHRFDGKETSILFDPHRPATWDMLGNRELTP